MVKEQIALELVSKEYARASGKYPPFNSAHEGYAVILEELEELWDEVKKKPSAVVKEKLKEEAVQTAAMAVRFLVDICMGEE